MLWIESVLHNKKFGKLTVVKIFAVDQIHRNNKWTCLCDCGSEVVVYQHQLLTEKHACEICLSVEKASKKKERERVKRSSWSFRKTKLRMFKLNAAKRQISWDLTDAEAYGVMASSCRYCNTKPSVGIDRLDNSQAYSLSNSVPCCGPCNMMKHTYSEEFFLHHVYRIFQHSCTNPDSESVK